MQLKPPPAPRGPSGQAGWPGSAAAAEDHGVGDSATGWPSWGLGQQLHLSKHRPLVCEITQFQESLSWISYSVTQASLKVFRYDMDVVLL